MRYARGAALAGIATLAATGLPGANSVRAQPPDTALEQCAGIAVEAERLACYDQAVRRSVPAPVPAPAPPAAPAAPAAPVAPVAEAVIELDTETMPPEGAADRSAHWRERAERDQSFSLLIVQREVNISGLSVFVTEDGAIFDQVSARRGRYPDPPFTAAMEPASQDSFWLSTDAGGRAVRVVERN